MSTDRSKPATAVIVASLFEIIPTFLVRSNVPTIASVHPYTPLEVAGNLTTVESNVEAGCMILSDNIRRLGEADGISAYFWGSDIRGVQYNGIDIPGGSGWRNGSWARATS